MPGAHVDSDALRQFADQLRQFSAVLNDEMASTQAQMARLGDSWRDPGYEEFRAVMAKTFPLLRTLVEEANQTVPKLQRDAQAVDDFSRLKPE